MACIIISSPSYPYSFVFSHTNKPWFLLELNLTQYQTMSCCRNFIKDISTLKIRLYILHFGKILNILSAICILALDYLCNSLWSLCRANLISIDSILSWSGLRWSCSDHLSSIFLQGIITRYLIHWKILVYFW